MTGIRWTRSSPPPCPACGLGTVGRWFVVLAGAALAVSALSPTKVDAQDIVITGTVTDAGVLTPVRSALVEALDRAGRPIEAVRADPDGVYRLVLERTDIVLLRATGFGYNSVRRSFRVPPDQSEFEVPFELDLEPIELDPLVANAPRQGLTPGRVIFEQHRALGRGTFFTGQEIWERDRGIQAILLEQPGLLMRTAAEPRSNFTGSFTRDSLVLTSNAGRGKCLNVTIDGWYVQRQESSFLDWEGMDPTMDMINDRSSSFEHWMEEIVAGDVHGMELYPAYEDVPEDLRVEAYPCGMVIIWQRAPWYGPGGGG